MSQRSKWKPVLKAAAVFVIFAAGANTVHTAEQVVKPTNVSDLRNAGSEARYWGKAALDCARAARELRVPGEQEGGEALAVADKVDAFLAKTQTYQASNRDEMVKVRWETEEKSGVAQDAFAECNLRRLAQEFDADREPVGINRGGGGVGGGGGDGGHMNDGVAGDDTGADDEGGGG